MSRKWERLASWEGLLLLMLIATVLINIVQSPFYLSGNNLINMFQLSIEKIIVVIVMTFIIINGEIDLSVASIMGLSACVLAWGYEQGFAFGLCILLALIVGLICGLINGFFVAYIGLPSLAVTLAGLIMYRGVARILLEDRSISNFPAWFNQLGQQPLIGPFPLAMLLLFAFFVSGLIILQRTSFGRYVYVIGNNKDVARYSGVEVRRVKMTLYIASALISALAGMLLAARLGTVRGSSAEGFELDIITIVLLGGVSIFGGSGTLIGVGLSILIIINLRNGMSLANINGDIQASVIGVLLILSVLIPNLLRNFRDLWQRWRAKAAI